MSLLASIVTALIVVYVVYVLARMIEMWFTSVEMIVRRGAGWGTRLNGLFLCGVLSGFFHWVWVNW